MPKNLAPVVAVALLCAWLASGAAASEPEFPLEPPNTATPRGTIQSFMEGTARATSMYYADADPREILWAFQRAERNLDLSQVSPDRVADVGAEAGLLIYEILNRAGLPSFEDIPGIDEVEAKELTHWRVPHTGITLVRQADGVRAGEFLFSAESVDDAREFYERVKHLPNVTSYPPGNYESYVNRPAIGVPFRWVDSLPDVAKYDWLRNPVWKWLAVLFAAALALVAAVAVRRLGRAFENRMRDGQYFWQIENLVTAIGLIVIPLVLRFFVHNIVGFRFEAGAILSKLLLALSFAAGVFAIFVLLEFAAEIYVSLRRRGHMAVNANLVQVSARITAVVASLYLVFEATEFLGLAIAPVLAGLGVGGLAMALAARPTLENVIGGFTLFADRPVRVGDFCRFGSEEGTVEEIGLRSTRIRLLDETLVSVPNAELSRIELHNYARRRARLYRTMLNLRYETGADQLRYLLAELRKMLIQHPKVSPKDLHVRFDAFGTCSLDIEIFAYLRTREWLEYRAIREDINFRIMDIVEASGSGFAFPSHTAYLARDSGLNADRANLATDKVAQWRSQGELPFPDFDEHAKAGFEDTLDYPPLGTSQNRPDER